MIDEFDQLYRVDSRGITAYLRAIDELANCPKQRVCVLLCGSASCLMNLICARKEIDEVKRRFPGVQHATSLNGTKFEELQLHLSRPNDYEAIRMMLRANNVAPTDGLVCAFAFLAGCNARQFEKVFAHV